MHCRRFSSTLSFEASKRTEFQPRARQAEMTSLRAMIEVQGDRHADLAGQLDPRLEEDLEADLLDRLDRCLDDQRGARLLGGGEHRFHGQLVDHVDGRHAVALAERPLEDRLGGNDRHLQPPRGAHRPPVGSDSESTDGGDL